MINFLKGILFFSIVNFSFLVACSNHSGPLSYYLVVHDTSQSEELSEEFYEELLDRSNDEIAFYEERNPRIGDTVTVLNINLNPAITFDVEITVNSEGIKLQGKNERAISWLKFQLIKKISEVDNRISGTDLPPAQISIDVSNSFNFAFEYSEPFFAPNLVYENNEVYGTHNLEKDWGLWGHNLGRLMKDETSLKYFSVIDGKRNRDQICFSSDSTFLFISDYIIKKGEENGLNSQNFVIAPNDNKLVCQCEQCLELGNSTSNASPANLYLLRRLAEKFNQHVFFTIDYLSIRPTKSEKLPDNIGVLISSIDLKKIAGFENNKKNCADFEKTIDSWKQSVNKIFVWEYSSNFDDYLSPFPNLLLFQERLEYYQKHQISGVFCNASGYSYSLLEGLKTFVMSALMINPSLDVEALISAYFKQYYPVSEKVLKDYYWGLEEKVMKSSPELKIYGGMDYATSTYLNEADFFYFHQAIEKLIEKCGEEEKERLKRMLVALSFTHLQIGMSNGFHEGGFAQLSDQKTIQVNLNFLNSFTYVKSNYLDEDITSFKESGGDMMTYLAEIKDLFLTNKQVLNELYGKRLTSFSTLDDGYENLDILSDGISGLSVDYHSNWLFNSSGNLKLKVPSLKLKGLYQIKITFLDDPKLKVFTPEKVVIKSKKHGEFELIQIKEESDFNRSVFKGQFKLDKSSDYYIEIVSNQKNNKIVCDEVSIYK